MLFNNIKTSIRSLAKNRFFTALNILGLSVGLACCMLVALYLFEETHYDRHHNRAADICRVGTVFTRENAEKPEDRESAGFNTPSPMGEALRREFGEIEKTARLQKVFSHDKTPMRLVDEQGAVLKVFSEPEGCFADSSYFELFRYDFIEGNAEKALCEPNTVVLSEEIARKFFGGQPAFGRVLRISNGWFERGDLDFKITGVFRKPDAPTVLDGRFFMSMYSGGLGEFVKTNTNLVNNNMFSTYLLLRPGTDAKALEAKLPAFVDKHMSEALKAGGFGKKQFLTAMPDVHLSGVGSKSVSLASGNKTYLVVLGSIALFTLLIACVNFMNLATARSAQRAGEVGVRKAVGASKSSLVGQFLAESVLVSLVSWLLALAMAWLATPFFNQMVERELVFSPLENPGIFAGFLGLALLTGLLSGVYPAFFLSAYRPVEVLKGKFVNNLSAAFLRKGLVVFQFVISAGLILASLVINRQMHFLQSTDLGFQKEQQIVLPLSGQAAQAAFTSLKSELSRDSRIASVGGTQWYPGIMNPSDAGFHREGQAVEQAVNTRRNFVDADFLKTLGFQAVAGRLFSPEFPADTNFRIIVNETAVKKYGFASPEEAVGKKIMFTWRGNEYRWEIIGVVRDFHFENLHEPIQPYSFELNARPPFNYIIAQARPGANLPALLNSIETTWEKNVPGEALEYSFLDEDFQKNYKNDRQMSHLVGSLTGMAILISCLGLFGLAAFAAERRTKEIGIRKVLGATVTSISNLLVLDFVKLVVVAILVASPLAYFFMKNWLNDFAYRIEMQWWMFAGAGVLAVAVACLTVGFQAVRAALANPVKSLRSE